MLQYLLQHWKLTALLSFFTWLVNSWSASYYMLFPSFQLHIVNKKITEIATAVPLLTFQSCIKTVSFVQYLINNTAQTASVYKSAQLVDNQLAVAECWQYLLSKLLYWCWDYIEKDMFQQFYQVRLHCWLKLALQKFHRRKVQLLSRKRLTIL